MPPLFTPPIALAASSWSTRCARVIVLVGAVALSGTAFSQVTQPASSPGSGTGGDQAVVLSPFEVRTDKDVGFVANSSLAGGRLAGELKDTPAAYSVLTREFIDALNIVDLHEANMWAVNSDYTPSDSSGDIFGFYNETTARGVGAGAPQRNFFPQNIDFDSYNLERFDYSRGPNSILFGAGSFGGAANVVTKEARTSRDFNSVALSYGSWNNRRATMDLNRALSNKLALRFNAVIGDRDGWRDYEMERKKAATLAGLWRLTRTTELRFEGERGEDQRNVPVTYLRDQFTGWDGRTVFNGLVKTTPSNAASEGIRINGSATSPYWIYAPGLGMTQVQNFAQTARTVGGNSSTATPVDGVLVVGPTANLSGNPYNGALNVPANWGSVAAANSHFVYPRESFALSTNTPTSKQIFNNYTLTLRQQFGDHVFVELAGNYSTDNSENQYFNVRGLGDIIIDINQTLPDGTPNRHFLDEYSDGTRSRRMYFQTFKNARFAVAYDTGKTRFGAFTFNTYGGINDNINVQRIESLRVLRNTDPRKWPFNDTVAYRYYFNDSDHPMPDISSATMTTNGVTTTYPVQWIGDSARATDVSEVDNVLKYIQGAARAKLFDDRLQLLGAVRYDHIDNSRKLNANYGDYPTNWDGRTVVYAPAAPADYATLMYTPKDANGNPIGAPRIADVRPRDSSRNPLPQYANDRFQDDYSPPHTRLGMTTYSVGGVYHVTRTVSVYANHATSFNPPGTSLRYDGSFNPPQQSKGDDAGVRLALLHDRVNVSLGVYRSSETNEQIQSTITNSINAFANANPIGQNSADGRNVRGLVNVPTQVFDTRDRKNRGMELEIVANLTSSWRLMFNAALPRAYQTNAWKDSRVYLAKNDATLRQIAADTGVLIDANNNATVDLSVPAASRSPDASAVASAWNNLQTFKQTLVSGDQKIIGVANGMANLFTDYRIKEGPLNGLSFGGGVNYRAKRVIGYAGSNTIVDPNNPTAAIDDPSIDAYTPVYTKAYFLATATLGYTHRLRANRTISFQLRVANLLNERYPLYYNTTQRPVAGNITSPARIATPDSFAYLTPRAFTFTTTLGF